MKKIMFVCHGNICRSPMAEFIFKDICKKRGADGFFYCASSATSTEEIWGGVGNPIYPPAKAELIKNGIPCNERQATLLKKEDYEKYDMFVGMDGNNIRNMHRIFGGDPQNKIKKLLDFTDRGGDVSDPWYSRNFGVAYADIREGCTALFEILSKA